jgi:hypothetical protein
VGGGGKGLSENLASLADHGFAAAKINRQPTLNAFIRIDIGTAIMKKSLAIAMLVCSASVAHAQATLHSQQKKIEDFCASDLDSAGNVNTPMGNSDIYSCGSYNYDPLTSDNPLAALKWYLIGARRGDYSAAEQIGMMYRDGAKGIPKNLVLAYAWVDIAAAMHGTCVDRLPAQSGTGQETNKREIDLRNYIGREMTDAQIKEALQFSSAFKITDYRWKYDSDHTPTRYVRVSTIGPDCGDD